MNEDDKNIILLSVLADQRNKKNNFLVIKISLLLAFTILIVSLFAIPTVLLQHEVLNNISSYEINFDKKQQSTQLQMNGVRPKHFFIFLEVMGVRKTTTFMDKSYQLKINMNIKGFSQKEHKEVKINYKQNPQIKINCLSREKNCEKNKLTVLYAQEYNTDYIFNINVQNYEEISQYFEKLIFTTITIHHKYSEFLIWSRFACLIISIGFGIKYIIFYIKSSSDKLTFEHKYILILTILSILFNDPIYFITILNNNIYCLFISNIFVSSFVDCLIFFWIIMTVRINKEHNQKDTKVFSKKILILGLIEFVLLTTSTITSSIIFRYLPSINHKQTLFFVYYISKISLFIYSLFLLICFSKQSLEIFKKWNQLLPRYQFFYIMSIYEMIIFFFLTFSGFYQCFEINGTKLLSLFTFGNFYVILLQLFWQFDEKKQIKNENSNDSISFEINTKNQINL